MQTLGTQGGPGDLEKVLYGHGFSHIAGVDEVGRGACFGPMVMAACILPPDDIPGLAQLTDSKKLSAATREKLFTVITECAVSYSIVEVSVDEITAYGLQQGNISGMRRAIGALSVAPDYVLTDALKIPGLTQPHLPILKGDSQARCISAASVLAKVTRDRMMVQMSQVYPEYGLEEHKGYGTKSHMDAVRHHGGTPQHRYTYKNVETAHKQWLAHHNEGKSL